MMEIPITVAQLHCVHCFKIKQHKYVCMYLSISLVKEKHMFIYKRIT